MSWNVTFIGNPERIINALDKESEKLNDQSKEEFDAAKPHLIWLLSRNFNKGEGSLEPTLMLSASGYELKDKYGHCAVKIKSIGEGIIV